MRKALYVSAFVPDERAPHAGGQAAFQNRAELARQGFEVRSFICSTEPRPGAADSKDVFFRQTTLRLAFSWMMTVASRQATPLLSMLFLDTRNNILFERALRKELETGSYEVVFIDFTQACLPVYRALRHLPARPKVWLCIHDLYVQKMLRDSRLLSKMCMSSTARIERTLLQWADEVITLSDKDRALAAIMYECRNVKAKPFVPPSWVHRVQRAAGTINPHEVLFFANFSRIENREAVAWFLREALQLLTQRFQDFQLVLGGAGSDTVPLPDQGKHVRRTGYVKDPSALFTTCAAAIAPLALGAGIKFKVLEAVAAGVPVVGTPVALEGVDPSELVIEAARECFVEKLAQLLRDGSH